MILVILAICLSFALVALLERSRAQERQQWATERRELLNRIQAPDRLPVAPMPHFEIPELAPDEIDRVGTISFDEEDPS